MKHMKQCLSLVFLLVATMSISQVLAQSDRPIQLTAGGFGIPGLYQGARLGVQLPWKTLSLGGSNMGVYFHPQVAYLYELEKTRSGLFHLEAGILRSNPEKHWFHAASAGLGYMAHNDMAEYSVNFRGEITNRVWDRTDYLMALAHYTVGYRFMPRWAVQFKAGYSWNIGVNETNRGMLLTELGLRFALRAPSSTQSE